MERDYPRISLEQWRALVAVVEAGSYAAAAQRLNRAQSSVTYAVQKLQHVLGVQAFERRGRRAVLTDAGEALVRRARILLEEALLLERGAGRLAAGGIAELRLAVDIVFPTWLLLECLEAFTRSRPQTRVELYETVLAGTEELLQAGRVDLAVGWRVPDGWTGELLFRQRFVTVAHPQHALHRLGRALTARDLRRHRHLVVRDTGATRTASGGPLTAGPRWTLGAKATSIRAACMGLGFASYPEDSIRAELSAGALKALSLADGGAREVELFLIYGDRDFASAEVRSFATLLRERVAQGCLAAGSA